MRDIYFMGKVLASVSHEMQNVMAIIKESAALANDVLQINGPPPMKHGDKLMHSLATIRNQIERGRGLMLGLNAFAHAAEDYPDCCDLTRFTKQIGVLGTRMVQIKECTLNVQTGDTPLLVNGNALFVMQTIYVAITVMLQNMAAGDTLNVRVVEYEKTPAISLHTARGVSAPPMHADLDTLMTLLNGHTKVVDGSLYLLFSKANVTEATTGNE